MSQDTEQVNSKTALQTSSSEPSRLAAVDALRGLIIVFMALDHANLLVAQKHSPGERGGELADATEPRAAQV